MEMTEIRQKLRHSEELKKAVEVILKEIGETPEREGLKRTPYRYAKACEEWFGGYGKNPKDVLDRKFKTGYKITGMIIIKDISYVSFCEHHLVPFSGTVDIAYIPKKLVSGLDKFVKLVEIYARRAQIQERMAEQIADAIWKELKPIGCMIIVKGKHLCVSSRETKNSTTEMVYSALRGSFNQSKVRLEFLELRK